MTVMVFRARRTLKVLSAETFPKSTNSVKYLKEIIIIMKNQRKEKSTDARLKNVNAKLHSKICFTCVCMS